MKIQKLALTLSSTPKPFCNLNRKTERILSQGEKAQGENGSPCMYPAIRLFSDSYKFVVGEPARTKRLPGYLGERKKGEEMQEVSLPL